MNFQPHHWQSATSTRLATIANVSFWIVLLSQLAILVLVFQQSTIPVEKLLRDGGAISDLGVMLWTATSAICALATLALLSANASLRTVLTFAAGAAFSGCLAIDDMFMLHDGILPNVGMPELATFAFYVVFTLTYVALSWRNVFAAAPWHLVFTGAVLATGLAIDITKDNATGPLLDFIYANDHMRIMGEDGFKFIGIGAWFTLHLRAALTVLARQMRFTGLNMVEYHRLQDVLGGPARRAVKTPSA